MINMTNKINETLYFLERIAKRASSNRMRLSCFSSKLEISHKSSVCAYFSQHYQCFFCRELAGIERSL